MLSTGERSFQRFHMIEVLCFGSRLSSASRSPSEGVKSDIISGTFALGPCHPMDPSAGSIGDKHEARAGGLSCSQVSGSPG
ncbi:hypothetical protein ACRRTK_004048 [Alexandromys fortis]